MTPPTIIHKHSSTEQTDWFFELLDHRFRMTIIGHRVIAYVIDPESLGHKVVFSADDIEDDHDATFDHVTRILGWMLGIPATPIQEKGQLQ